MIALLAAMALASAIAPTGTQITAPGPQGPLAGTLVEAGENAPVVLIIPGSGPTDRDGNSPLGITAASYRLLAEALAERGVASVRIDKRGMFGSKAAIPDPNAVTIDGYADDIHAWVQAIRTRTGAKCIWVAGHSEGGLVALVAAQRPDGICGVIEVSAMGRPFGTVLRGQLSANPANQSILPQANAALDALEAGKHYDTADLPPPLVPLFHAGVQDYLIDIMARDPAALAGTVKVPMLIVQGDQDLQVTTEDARALKAGQPDAKLTIVPGVNHVLKKVPANDTAANMAAYADPSQPVDTGVVDAIVGFVKPAR